MAYTLGKAALAVPGRVANALSVESMSPEAKFFAHLSSVAYKEPAERPLHQNECDLDPEFNMERFVVYTRGWFRVKAVIIAYRGTTTLSDLLDDLKLATNTDMTRLKKLLSAEVDCITALAKKYPGARMHATGHSLGGSMAMFVAAHTGLIRGGHIFNPGAGFKAEEILLGAVAMLMGAATGSVLGVSVAAGALAHSSELSHESYGVGEVQELTSRINVHHVIGDPLSMLFTVGNVFCYTPKQVNLHALSNFLDDDVPSTEGMFSYPSKEDGIHKTSFRARSVDHKTDSRKDPTLRATSVHHHRHSHSGIGGWTEVVGQGGVGKTLVERLSMQADLDDEDWRSTLDVGSIVEVLAHGGTDRSRSWVQAEVVISREKTLTLKWSDGSGAGEIFRRVARVSTEMRALKVSSIGAEVDETIVSPSSDGPKSDQTSCPLRKRSLRAHFTKLAERAERLPCEISAGIDDPTHWASTLKVGGIADVLVKKQWIPAEVAIARGRVLTMKWTDRQDGGEVLRRVARDSTELRPHKMSM